MRPLSASAEAVLVGLVQGPAELLPISSSGHVAALRALLGSERDAELEVAVHAGAALALMIGLRGELREAARRPAFLVAASVPPALIGLGLERVVEERLGTPRTIAAGLVAGSVALVMADRTRTTRGRRAADVADGLWLGLAQAAALVPGVSRNGATLAAARARGFGRTDANRLSRQVALPVLVGASGLKARRRGSLSPALALGAAAACASTLVALRLLPWVDRDRPLAWWAGHRPVAAAAIVGAEVWRGRPPG